jgi:thymidylate synthase (FAD)
MLVTVDVRNFLHFLELRCHPAAQWETRQYAIAMAHLTKPYFISTYEIWYKELPQEIKEQLNG